MAWEVHVLIDFHALDLDVFAEGGPLPILGLLDRLLGHDGVLVVLLDDILELVVEVVELSQVKLQVTDLLLHINDLEVLAVQLIFVLLEFLVEVSKLVTNILLIILRID